MSSGLTQYDDKKAHFLSNVADLEDLLCRLQKAGYENKRSKYISCRAPGQERFTQLKTLGVDYTEEALAARIAGFSRPSRQPKQRNRKNQPAHFVTSSGVGKA